MFPLVSCDEQCAPSQAKLLCCILTDTVGPQTRITATSVPCFQPAGLPELNMSAACMQPYLSCCVADIRGAGKERECHCIFELDSTLLYGSLTDGSKLQVLSLFSPSVIPKHVSSHFCGNLLPELLIKHHSSRQ